MQNQKSSKRNDDVVFKRLDQNSKLFLLAVIQTRKKCIYSIIGVVATVAVLIGLFLFLSLSDSGKSVRCTISDTFHLELVECMQSDTLDSLKDGKQYSSITTQLCGNVTHMEHGNMCNDSINREVELRILAEKSFNILYEVFNDEQGWQHDRGDSIRTGIVYSKMYEGIGRVMKMKVHLDATLDQVRGVLIDHVDETPSWNLKLAIVKTVERIADDLLIMHYATNNNFLSFVSPRDFVVLRLIRTVNNATYTPAVATTHPDVPPLDDYVRGFYKIPSGVMFAEVDDNPNKILLQTTTNLDIQMWVPQFLVNREQPKAMLAYAERLRAKLKEMNRH